jgi:integrase
LPRDGAELFPGIATAGSERRGTFGRILAAAGVVDPDHILDFHCWRHTFRTRLRDAGVSEKLCNELGGWSEAGAGDRYDHSLEPLRAAIAADK